MTSTTALGLIALAGSAITIGVLLSVAVSLVPVFLSLSPSRYVQVHKVAGRYFDRFMPPAVVLTTITDVLAATRARPPSQVVFALAAVFLLGVSLVSQFGNVPINKVVKAVSLDSLPQDGLTQDGLPGSWQDPRGRWRQFHLWRTSFAAMALVANVAALYLT